MALGGRGSKQGCVSQLAGVVLELPCPPGVAVLIAFVAAEHRRTVLAMEKSRLLR